MPVWGVVKVCQQACAHTHTHTHTLTHSPSLNSAPTMLLLICSTTLATFCSSNKGHSCPGVLVLELVVSCVRNALADLYKAAPFLSIRFHLRQYFCEISPDYTLYITLLYFLHIIYVYLKFSYLFAFCFRTKKKFRKKIFMYTEIPGNNKHMRKYIRFTVLG